MPATSIWEQRNANRDRYPRRPWDNGAECIVCGRITDGSRLVEIDLDGHLIPGGDPRSAGPESPATLTVDDIERGYTDERWLGWGYLGGRRHLAELERDAADRLVIDYANTHRWSYERLFTWCNSRPGRHFADDPDQPSAEKLLAAKLDVR